MWCQCHVGIGDCDIHGVLDRAEWKKGRRVRIMSKKQELLNHIRSIDLKAQSIGELAAWCQALGQSGRGSKDELVKKLRKIGQNA